MGDVSVIARRLECGKHLQYGWSGNGGYHKMVGSRLLEWYNEPANVEYLFSLGQLSVLGKPGSEKGGVPIFFTTETIGKPHWLGTSECDIFSKIHFIDYGYFYDLDNIWYYVIPKPFRIKIPLLYIEQHLDQNGFEFKEREKIDSMVIEYILFDYYSSDTNLQKLINKKYPEGIDEIRSKVYFNDNKTFSSSVFFGNYRDIFEYFDNWVVVKTSKDMKEITGFLIKKKQTKKRIETINW